MLQYIQPITLDVAGGNVYKYIYAKQGDSGSRYVCATILANGKKITIGNDVTAEFRAVKKDGKSVMNPATINSDGTITVELTQQTLAVEGIVDADIIIKNNSGDVLSTASFKILVEKAPVGEQIDSANELLALAELIETGEETISEVEAKLATIKEGEDGFSPIVNIDSREDGTTVSITDAYGEHEFEVLNGTTPVKGVDYFTAADKAEIVADVLAAGANIPDYVRTAAAAVAEKVLGVTGEATAAASAGGSYTNRLPLSIDSSGAVYNTTGYKTGYRLNSSGAEKQITESYYDSSVCVTGFIPCTAGDVIRLAGLVIDPADTQAGAYNLAVYDSSFAKVDVASWKDVLTHASATTDSDGHISAITLSGKFGTADVAYIRLSAKGVTADSIVTVNEEIGGGGTVTVDASRVPFNLAFLTDLHWNDDDAGRLEHAAGALSVIHETAPLDAVVFGGDYIRNWSAVTAAEAREDISMCRECFAAAVDAPALWLRGNHDNNPYPGARLSKPEIFNRISRAQNTLRGFVSNPHDPYGCYGYMDFENARMRLVIVNTSDNDAFGMASLSGSYSALLDAYSISAAQLQWVADHALDFSDKASPEDWGLVFLSHAPIYSADSWSNTHTYTDSDGVAWTCNVVNLANLVKAYADKSSFSASLNGEIVSKDFSGLSSTAKVLCFVNGHKHALLSSSYNGFTFISCPNACNAGEKASADGTTYSKSAAGTAGETAFTALTIDPANSKVYAWVYGSGYDRTLTL